MRSTAPLSVVYRQVDDLVPYARNSRTHSPAQVAEIAASIKEFGFTNPLLVDEDGSIIAGHGRLLAARKLGLAEVPTIALVGLSEAQRRALVIADNRIAANAGWDEAMLKTELDDLVAANFDVSLLGFDDKELAKLVSPADGSADEAKAEKTPPVPAEPVTERGDVWICGRHRVMCGDSTDRAQVDRLIGPHKIDLVHTDPPYGVDVGSSGKRRGEWSRASNRLAPENGNENMKEFDDSSVDAARAAFKICDALKIPRQVWWGANYYAHAVPETANWFVWDKRVEEKQSDVNSDCELAWVRSKRASVRIFRHLWKGLIKESERGEARVHPTQKPVALVEWVIDYYKDVKTVLDLFGGSGSTLIGAERKGCDAFIMEFETVYADVIVTRWAGFTGETPILEETGETFAEVLARRRPDATPTAKPAKKGSRK